MSQISNGEHGPTVWGFLAIAAEAWPLILAVPLILGTLAYFVTNSPVEFESSVNLPVPQTQLQRLLKPAAVEVARAEAGFGLTSQQILQQLSTAPDAKDRTKSILRLRYEAPLDGTALLETVETQIMLVASPALSKGLEEAIKGDLANAQAKLQTLELAMTSIRTALSTTEAVSTDVGGLAEAALALVQISKEIEATRIKQRHLQQQLLDVAEELNSPVVVITEPIQSRSPFRTAFLVAVGAETLMLLLVVLWNRIRHLRLSESDYSNLARIRRAFGLRTTKKSHDTTGKQES